MIIKQTKMKFKKMNNINKKLYNKIISKNCNKITYNLQLTIKMNKMF